MGERGTERASATAERLRVRFRVSGFGFRFSVWGLETSAQSAAAAGSRIRRAVRANPVVVDHLQEKVGVTFAPGREEREEKRERARKREGVRGRERKREEEREERRLRERNKFASHLHLSPCGA